MGDSTFTALHRERLVLRRFRPEDLDALVAYRSDPVTARYQSWDAYRSADRRLCGPCPGRGLVPGRDRLHPCAAAQGYGYAIEAVRRLLHYLLIERGKHRVRATCNERNTSSVAVLERVGMRREGHLLELPGL